MIRVILPYHLQNLAQVEREVQIQVEGALTVSSVLDALESSYPALRGTIRDRNTSQRRPYLRFFTCGQDYSLEPPDTPLPEAVRLGQEPFRVVGAMAGG